MIFQSFVSDCGPLEVNLHLMGNAATREALLVDAGVLNPEIPRFLDAAGLTLTDLLLTHHHHDHIDALPEFLDKWPGLRVFSPASHSRIPGAQIVCPGTTFKAAGFAFLVFQTSGHTPESISYYCATEGICFVGDAIFAGAVGGTASDELHAEEIMHLRRDILTLPQETELHSGHGPATTVAIEAAANPFLQPGFTRLP